MQFDNTQLKPTDRPNIMPNPVLLSPNPGAAGSIFLDQVKIRCGSQSSAVDGLYDLKVQTSSRIKPIWILDGQHRIRSLAKSTQSENPIPFVLLFDPASVSVHNGSLFAKIFAEVTTLARGLHPFHLEWLSRAFELGSYREREHRDAMDTVLHLVSENVQGNHFFDNVRLNPDAITKARTFDYDVIKLKNVIYEYYYKLPLQPPAVRLNPKQITDEIILATSDLHTIITNHQNSVFFGSPQHKTKIVQTGFLSGVLSYLLKHTSKSKGKHKYKKADSSWLILFKRMGFDKEDWDFSSWTASLHGRINIESRRIIVNTFRELFENRTAANTDYLSSGLVDFLQGDNGRIKFKRKESKRSKKGTITKVDLLPIAGKRHRSLALPGGKIPECFILETTTPNILIRSIRDEASDPDDPRTFKPGKNIEVNSLQLPLKLSITSGLFGGNQEKLELRLKI